MGMLDNMKNFFRGSNDNQVAQKDDTYKKSMLAAQIVDSIDKIKRIDCFDRSIRSLANVSTYDLKRKSLSELERLQSSLNSRLSELTRQSNGVNLKREALEESKWTGKKIEGMTAQEFDRLQRDDER